MDESNSKEWLAGFRAGFKAALAAKENIRQFESLGVSHAISRGIVYSVEMPNDLWNPHHLVHSKVLLDGKYVQITAVESHLCGFSPQHPYVGVIGITVEAL